MATHSSTLAWRIPWTEELGGLQSTGRKESDTTERLHFHFQDEVMLHKVHGVFCGCKESGTFSYLLPGFLIK